MNAFFLRFSLAWISCLALALNPTTGKALNPAMISVPSLLMLIGAFLFLILKNIEEFQLWLAGAVGSFFVLFLLHDTASGLVLVQRLEICSAAMLVLGLGVRNRFALRFFDGLFILSLYVNALAVHEIYWLNGLALSLLLTGSFARFTLLKTGTTRQRTIDEVLAILGFVGTWNLFLIRLLNASFSLPFEARYLFGLSIFFLLASIGAKKIQSFPKAFQSLREQVQSLATWACLLWACLLALPLPSGAAVNLPHVLVGSFSSSAFDLQTSAGVAEQSVLSLLLLTLLSTLFFKTKKTSMRTGFAFASLLALSSFGLVAIGVGGLVLTFSTLRRTV